jgi:hypothetical protein
MDRRQLLKSLTALVGVPIFTNVDEAKVLKYELKSKARYLFVVNACEDFGIVARQLSQLGVEGAILPCYGDPEEAIKIYELEKT